ncbi:MAG TPA: hypothetical protein VIG99_01305 [Myxococcaceae bacterium]|jgi:hypothetical protein
MMTPPEPPAAEPADMGGSAGMSDGGGMGPVGGATDAGSAGDAGGASGAEGISSSSSGPTEVQRQLQQDSFQPASEQRGSGANQADAQQADARSADAQQADARRDDIRQSDQKRDAVTMSARRDTFEASARRSPPTTAPQQPAQTQPRERFQVNMSEQNRGHLARQAGEISQKWNQFTGWAQRTGDWFRNNVPGVKQLNDAGAAIGDFTATKTIQAAQATGLDKVQVKVPEAVLDAADAVTKPILSNADVMNGAMTAERFTYGVGMEAAGTVEGVHQLATTNPVDTAKALGKAVQNLPETGQQIKKELTEAWNKDPVEFVGRAAFEVGSFLIPGGQAKGAVGAAEAAEHVGQAARLAHGVEELGEAARVANGLEHAGQAAEVARGVERTAQVGEVARAAEGVEDAARAGRVAEQAARPTAEAAETAGAARKAEEAARTAAKAEEAAPKLVSGSEEYSALQKSVEAKEELARRLRDTVGGRYETLPGGRGHAMSGATGGAPPQQLASQAAKLEKQAAEGRQLLQQADRAAEAAQPAATAAKVEEVAGTAAKAEGAAQPGNAVVRRIREARAAEEAARAAPKAEEAAGTAVKAEEAANAAKAATPKNVWIDSPKQFPHKIPGSKPTRAMLNDNGTVRYQWLDKQGQLLQEAVVKKDGRVVWGQAPAGRVEVPKGSRPNGTPAPINGAPTGNEIRGHFVPYEMTGKISNSGANMGKQNAIMNGTNPYRALEDAAVKYGHENPGKARYLVVSKADKAGVETARRQVLYERAAQGRSLRKEFDNVSQAVHDPTHGIERSLASGRAPKPPPAPPAAPPTP